MQDIQVAVYRYLLEKFDPWLQGKAAVYCLAAQGEHDPPDAVISQFASHEPPVKERSECDISPAGVVDRQSQRAGVLFYIKSVRWITDQSVSVLGGYKINGYTGSYNRYLLIRRNMEWVLVDDKVLSWF
jgi:hypothetical protein